MTVRRQRNYSPEHALLVIPNNKWLLLLSIVCSIIHVLPTLKISSDNRNGAVM